ncbi:MAG TPA: pyruvate:ferredoxin (flavodoxin) oxidoreductase [Desulfitobacteriaceae bacterium]|nr:pyruvate:ferredoxin (flavodoxin) oxidoreductase [Desulfitobacteriaceae bacterium]
MAKTKTMDGCEAAAYASYAFTEVACIFPITPSSPMAEFVDEWSANGKTNLFGQTVKVSQLQSEAGAAGSVHGSLQAGALTTTYTASQGLLLMIPNMYKMAGQFLPSVFHVSARSLATHALNIFGDHSDVMSVRSTGYALLASSNVQEAMDLGMVAHLCAIKARIPFLHFFDGFRTSHEIQKIELIDYDDVAKIVDWQAIQDFRDRSMNPERPVVRGTNQNGDIFFTMREACNKFYDAVPDVVEDYMKKMEGITGRPYNLFDYYGAPDAENIIIAMGSVNDTIEETIDYLAKNGEKVGLLKVRLYRPFSAKHFLAALPKSVKKIAVLDRVKEPGALCEPLYQDVTKIFYDTDMKPLIVGGRYGLGSKDVTPVQIKAVYDNLKHAEPKNNFTIGIIDDVTNTSLPEGEVIETSPEGTINCKFFGIGADGTVGANKEAIKIIGENTDMYAQAYFQYDSKKSGGVTISHLRFGKKLIKSPYYVVTADYIACHNPAYVGHIDLTAGLKKNGTFLLNCQWTPEELEEKLPGAMKSYLAKNNINFYTIDAVDIAQKVGLGGRINMICQAAFFVLSKVIPVDEAIGLLKDSVVKAYGKKGPAIVEMNHKAIDAAIGAIVKIDVPATWASAVDVKTVKEEPDFIKNILRPISKMDGDSLPVSAFNGIEDGSHPLGTAAYEKRGIAVNVPEWILENCIQCNQCSMVCPHAAIRPFLLDDCEVKNVPATFAHKKAIGKGLEGLEYRIQVTPLDCTGCTNCVTICPAKEKALVMKPATEQVEQQAANWDFAVTLTDKSKRIELNSVKNSQFSQPLFEFNGACPGCGETPYLKLVTQLFGDRLMMANATGCSSIYCAAYGSVPFCTNAEGKGPTWANSLFEDSAEFGYGLYLGVKQIREKLADLMTQIQDAPVSDALKAACKEWIANMLDAEGSKAASAKVLAAIAEDKSGNELAKEILVKKDYLIKKSNWANGGDGWAYDIGYGGVDHVLASGEDINILVLDTEVYSNTGGQASKSTPTGAIAKFQAAGKKIRKKDLGMMAMSYGYVYVAQISMGADMNQALKAIKEAEAYPGPSLVIAYSPCINQGLKAGMENSLLEAKKAVEAGYWHMYRYNPLLEEEGKNPFILDSKEPTGSFRDFIMGEVRYNSLKALFPAHAEELYVKAEADAKRRYQTYKTMAGK